MFSSGAGALPPTARYCELWVVVCLSDGGERSYELFDGDGEAME